MPAPSAPLPDGPVYTVDVPFSIQSPERNEIVSGWRADSHENDQSFDLAVVEFNDDGALVDPSQKQAAADCITSARRSNPNGALVVVFVHGWHHNARWDPSDGSGDPHFAGFRRILKGLTMREAERYFSGSPHRNGRRVVGVYLTWQGEAALFGASGLRHLGFFGRYRAAKRIGRGDDLRMTIGEIVHRTKCALTNGPPEQPGSPLALIGHSMGALMLESAFRALLESDAALLQGPAQDTGCMKVTRGGKPVSFPDVVIALNSAADSRTTQAIESELKKRKMMKSVSADEIAYSPPFFVSATSAGDWATKVIWRLAPFNFLRKTAGHDKKLFTHTLEATSERGDICRPKGGADFGQSWSCLRHPDPPRVASPAIAIDLPDRDRTSLTEEMSHTRYRLTPLAGNQEARPAWIFQIPRDISADHNDIFNPLSGLLVLALMQISGAVMSLAKEWKDNFEPLAK